MRPRQGPARTQQRLSRRHEFYLYLSASLLMGSGVGWLVAHFLLRAAAANGLGPHPAEAWWMRLHGGAVIGFLVTFGALLPGHVVPNWRQRRNRYTGLSVVIFIALLAVTGYGLYYLVDDRQRAISSAGHWVLGLLGCAALLLHVVLGKRLAARARERRMLHRLKPGSHRAQHRQAASPGDVAAGPG